MMRNVDPDVVRLADAMDELAAFLAAHHERRWADWVAEDARLVRAGDGYGVTHFLSAFGGMGSLNDVLFHPRNGNATADEADALNEEFERLRSAAWSQANALREDADRGRARG